MALTGKILGNTEHWVGYRVCGISYSWECEGGVGQQGLDHSEFGIDAQAALAQMGMSLWRWYRKPGVLFTCLVVLSVICST